MAIESSVPAWLQPYYDQQGLFGTIAPTNYGSRTEGAESFFSSLPSYSYSNLVSQQPVSYQQTLPYTRRRRRSDTNAPTIEEIEAELGLAGTMEPTWSNIAAVLGNLVSFGLNPGLFGMTQFANIGLGRNSKTNPSFASLARDVIGGRTGGYDGFGNYGTSGVDPDAYADAVTTAAFDAFGAAFDGPGTASWSGAVEGLTEGVDVDEAPGGIDYSGEVGGYNDPSGIDFSAVDVSPGYGGYAGSEEGSGDGGGDGGKVICTELHRQGILSKTIYLSDQEFGRKLAIEDPEAFAGYHAWAIPVVSLMKKSYLFTKFVAVFALPWAREMHYMETSVGKSSLLGRCMVKFGVPLCRFIGRRSSTELSSG